MTKRFNYYYMEQQKEYLFLDCQFEKITKEIEDETKALFSMVYLMLECDVYLDLKTPNYLNINYINLVLNLGRNLKQSGRKLKIANSPLSFSRFVQRFKLDKLVLLQGYS